MGILVVVTAKRRHPGKRGMEVLEHVARYRISVVRAVERLPAFEQVDRPAVRKLLGNLERDGFLGKGNLVTGSANHPLGKYYFLTPRGSQWVGGRTRTGPVAPPARLRAYAILWFCCLAEVLRFKYTAEELRKDWPALYSGGPAHYYIDTEGDADRLALLRVDGGKGGRWEVAVRRIQQDVASRCSSSPFRKFVLSHRFGVTILTATERKAERLLEEAEHRLATCGPIHVRTCAVPGLLDLILDKPDPL